MSHSAVDKAEISTKPQHAVATMPLCLSTIQGDVKDMTLDLAEGDAAVREVTVSTGEMVRSWRLTEMQRVANIILLFFVFDRYGAMDIPRSRRYHNRLFLGLYHLDKPSHGFVNTIGVRSLSDMSTSP